MTEIDPFTIMLCLIGATAILPIVVLLLYMRGQQRTITHKPRLSPEQQVIRKRQVKSMIDKIGKL